MNRRLVYLAIGLAGLVAILFIIRQPATGMPSMGGDRFAAVIYMSIWGALVGSAVISRPEGFGKSLKQLVVWIGILLVVMAGYNYRYELQDIGARLSGGLIPGSPISSVNNQGRTQITLLRNSSGQFSARGSVNGVPVVFLVDTGATDVVLSNGDAKRAGIDTNALSYNIPVSTANGMTTSARITSDNVSVGPISYRRINVMIAQPGDLQGSLLGMDFINRLQSFEIRGDRMILTQ